MLLIAAMALFLIALVKQSDAWIGFSSMIYFVGVGVAIVGWGLSAVSTALPVTSGWDSVVLLFVTWPVGIPVWQSLVIATILFFVAVATADTESTTSGDTTDSSSPGVDSVRAPKLEELPGIGDQKATALRDAGYEDADDILAASQAELTDVDGIGNALAARLIASVEDRGAESSTADSTQQRVSGSTNGAVLSPDEVDTDTTEQYTDREKTRLVAGLEATCNRIETLVEADAVADANDRLPAARAAVRETRDALTSLSGDRDLRLRVNDVEDRLDAVPTEAEAQYHELIGDGDAHVTAAQEAAETGEVEAGLEACENAHAVYRSARQMGQTANEAWFTEEEAALDGRIASVESLTDRLEHEREVQQAEATIDTLTQRVSALKETSELREAKDIMQSIVADGNNALARLPDNITASELERRVTHLREQVTEFEAVAEHLAAQAASAPSDTPSESSTEAASPMVEDVSDTADATETVSDEPRNLESRGAEHPSDPAGAPEESRSVVRTIDGIDETPQHTTPVVLRIREQLTEDGRRHVFRAETGDGESVQLDVWNRHVGEVDWEPDAWYAFENVRGQQWTVNGESGVTISTTPDVTVTERDSGPDADAATG